MISKSAPETKIQNMPRPAPVNARVAPPALSSPPLLEVGSETDEADVATGGSASMAEPAELHAGVDVVVVDDAAVVAAGVESGVMVDGGAEVAVVEAAGVDDSVMVDGGAEVAVVEAAGVEDSVVVDGGAEVAVVEAAGVEDSVVVDGGAEVAVVEAAGVEDSVMADGGAEVGVVVEPVGDTHVGAAIVVVVELSGNDAPDIVAPDVRNVTPRGSSTLAATSSAADRLFIEVPTSAATIH
jgi:hypothetical protein